MNRSSGFSVTIQHILTDSQCPTDFSLLNPFIMQPHQILLKHLSSIEASLGSFQKVALQAINDARAAVKGMKDRYGVPLKTPKTLPSEDAYMGIMDRLATLSTAVIGQLDFSTEWSSYLTNAIQPEQAQSEPTNVQQVIEEVPKIVQPTEEIDPLPTKDLIHLSMDAIIPKNTDDIKSKVSDMVSHLSLNNNKLSDSLARLLKEAKLPYLVYLSLESNDITTEGFKELATIKFGHLKYFYFANNQLGNAPEAFPKNWQNLLYLSLTNNKITVDGLPDLQNLFPKLRYLSLKSNKIGDEGFGGLLSLQHTNLQALHIQSCGLVEPFSKVNKLDQVQQRYPQMTKIYFGNNVVSTKGLKEILRSKLANKVTVLGFDKISLNAQHLTEFKENQGNLTSLTALDLSDNPLTIDNIILISSLKLPNLQRLYIKRCGLEVIQSLYYLKAAPFPCLRSIQMDGNNIESSQQYKVKLIMGEFISVIEHKKCSKVHINV